MSSPVDQRGRGEKDMFALRQGPIGTTLDVRPLGDGVLDIVGYARQHNGLLERPLHERAPGRTQSIA